MNKYTQNLNCNYCGGDGYVQLLLGGSETCYACEGSGKKSNEHQK